MHKVVFDKGIEKGFGESYLLILFHQYLNMIKSHPLLTLY